MSKRRRRRRASSAARTRRLEAAVQAIQQQWGVQALRKGASPAVGAAIPSLPTGLPPLDHILASGGLPLGHISELIGQPTSGKRTLALHVLAHAQRRYPCLYLDLAQTFDPGYAAACHVDLARLVVAAPANPSQALDLTCDLAGGGHFGLIVFDSTAELLGEAFPPGAAAAVLRRLHRALAQKQGALLFLTTPLSSGRGLAERTSAEPSPDLLYPPGFDLGDRAALRLGVRRLRWLRNAGAIRGYEIQVTVLRSRWGGEGREARVKIAFNGVDVSS